MNNINYKEYKSWNGYTFDDDEFIEKSGFVEIRSFNFQEKDEEFNVCIGKIGNDFYYYKDNYGKIWADDLGKINE